jgi:hypothetical protein
MDRGLTVYRAAPLLLPLVAGVLLGGCGGRGAPASVSAAASAPDWRHAATPADRARLRTWRATWLEALGRARADGAGAALQAQGVLFAPDTALDDPVPPAGSYRCRTFKLGARRAGTRQFVAYPAFPCEVTATGGAIRFRKTGGTQRPVGSIFTAGSSRAVFLGTLLIGDETHPIGYGRDNSRDMAGFVERIAPRRWRISLPLPAFDSTLDVIEVVPVG